MDFIAEMVLGYAELELSKCLEKKNIKKYKILRYRDDYRIFSHSPIKNAQIVKCLTEVMIDLGLKLNAEKTNSPTNVIKGVIKSDKLYWIKQKQTEIYLQNHLLIILNLSMQFTNCGSLYKALGDFYKKLSAHNKIDNSIIPLISIAVDIAYQNPRTYPHVAAIISLLLKFEKKASSKKDILERVIRKFNDIPNTGHLDIWVQRIALGIKCRDLEFKENLCKLAYNKENVDIWNFSWLNDSLKNKIDVSSIVDADAIEQLSQIITKDEVALFKDNDNIYG